jgi:hypothetical protein
MKLDFENLLTEREFAEIKLRAEKFDVFEFIKLDKENKIELRICGQHCDDSIWKDNYFCGIGGSKIYGDYYGFRRPYQRAEFLRLTYPDVAKVFDCCGYEMPRARQLDMFAMI